MQKDFHHRDISIDAQKRTKNFIFLSLHGLSRFHSKLFSLSYVRIIYVIHLWFEKKANNRENEQQKTLK